MKNWLIVAIAGVLLAACENTPDSRGVQKNEAKREAAPELTRLSDAQKQFLTIEVVQAAESGDVLALPGRVVFGPRAQSAIGASAAGRVAAVLVRAGEKVRSGQPLLRIESADAAAARAALEQAGTRLASADALFRRNLTMMEKI